MTKVMAREVLIPDENGNYDPLGHDVCLKISPKCPGPCGPMEPYEKGEIVCLTLCEKGWCEDEHEPVPITKHELGLIIAELGELFAEMTFGPVDIGIRPDLAGKPREANG